MDNPETTFLKRFLIIAMVYTTAILIWLVLTPSLSTDTSLWSYSSQRLVMIGMVILMIIVFAAGLIQSRNVRLKLFFGKMLASQWLFLCTLLITIAGLIVISGTLVNLFGKWSMLLDRLLPISTLILFFSLEIVIFQLIFTHGRIRPPQLFGRAQPFLLFEKQLPPEPIKKNILLYVLIILLPAILSGLLVALQNPVLTNFRPAENDEIVYWQEIASFKDYGFQAGNFSFNELTADGIFSHFGGHGPVFGVTYGLLGRLLGWQRSSGPLFNLLIICLSLGLFLWITRPNNRQSIGLIFLTGLFYPMLYYMPTIMQESLNFAVAILLCAFLVRFSRDDHPTINLKIGALCVLLFASALRITWVIPAFPLFYLLSDPKSKYRFLRSIVWAGLFSLAMAWLYLYWTSEYPVGFLYSFFHQNTLKGMADLLMEHLQINWKLFFRTTQINGFEIVFQYQFLLVTALYAINRNSKNPLAKSNLFMLVSILVFMFVIYDFYDLRPMRTMASFLLIGLLSLVFFANRKVLNVFIKIYVVVCILTAGVFYQLFRPVLESHFSVIDLPMEQGFAKAIQKLEVNPEKSPWCNSILTSYPYFNEVRLLPPGIGINLLLTDPEEFEIKSHYVYLPYVKYEQYNLAQTCKPLYQSDDRVMCVKMDDDCGTN